MRERVNGTVMIICRDSNWFQIVQRQILGVCDVDVFLPRNCCVGGSRVAGFLGWPSGPPDRSLDDLAKLVRLLAQHAGSTRCFVWRVITSPAWTDDEWLQRIGELPLVEFDPRSSDETIAAWCRGELSVGKYFIPDAVIYDPIMQWFIYFQNDFNCGVFAHPDPAFGRGALAASVHEHALTVAEAEASGVIWPDGMHDEAERHAFFRAMEANFER